MLDPLDGGVDGAGLELVPDTVLQVDVEFGGGFGVQVDFFDVGEEDPVDEGGAAGVAVP